jgi:hypothetical protein
MDASASEAGLTPQQVEGFLGPAQFPCVRMCALFAVLDTPEFYLLKDGKVIGKRSGWPAEGNRTALLQLLDAGRRQQ